MATKRKRAQRKPARRRATSTALVRRPKLVALIPRSASASTVSYGNGYTVAADGSLMLGALGLVELKLTEKEEQVLSERVPVEKVEWKPRVKDGPPEIAYLPHHVYTHWLNRAFGRTGWTLVPIGKPVKSDGNVVLVPYVLHVHGKPIAFAWGEQEFFPDNKQQTYGDVIESTVASALRRCVKHLGVGLEMWDRHLLRSLPRPGRDGQQPVRSLDRWPPSSQPAGYHGKFDDPITQPQRQRLYVIAKHAGRADTELKMWLKVRYGIDSSKYLKRRDYDEACRLIEAPGPLPMPRDPGEDG